MVDNKMIEDLKRAEKWLSLQEDFNIGSDIGFEWLGQWITCPFVDDAARFEVDPVEYYGEGNIREFLALAKASGVI